MFSPIKFVFTQIQELANEAPHAYIPFRLAVKSIQPQDVMFCWIPTDCMPNMSKISLRADRRPSVVLYPLRHIVVAKIQIYFDSPNVSSRFSL